MIWPRLKISWRVDNSSAGNSERSKGRQKKRWYVSIKELIGVGFGDTCRAAKDRER